MNKIWQFCVSRHHHGSGHTRPRNVHTRWSCVCINTTSMTKSHLWCQRCWRPDFTPSHFPVLPILSISEPLTQQQTMAFQNNVLSQLFKPLQYHNARVHNHRTFCSLSHTHIDIRCLSSHSTQNYDTYSFHVILLTLARGEKRERVWKNIEKMALHHCI